MTDFEEMRPAQLVEDFQRSLNILIRGVSVSGFPNMMALKETYFVGSPVPAEKKQK